MRVVQTPQRSQWGNPGVATNRGYGTAQQRQAPGQGRLPVASSSSRGGGTMSPTRMRMGGTNKPFIPPPNSHMRTPQAMKPPQVPSAQRRVSSPQRRVESRQVPVSPPQVPKKQTTVIDLTDIDERDIDNLHPKRATPMIGPPKNYRPPMNRPLISPPRGYQFPVPPTSKQQKPHVPNVMPECGRKPRVMSHHSEVQRLPIASASRVTPESPRSPMLQVATTNPTSPRSRGSPVQQESRPKNTAQQRLANAHASRAAKQNRSVPQKMKNQTKQAAPNKEHAMSIADRLRAVNDSRPGAGQGASEETKETIDGPLPQIPKQAKKEVQPSFDSAYNSAYSAYSAYTSCTEYSNYTEPSMDSDITPFETNSSRKKRGAGVENELIQHTSGKLASNSVDEYDAKDCLIATKELTELLAHDVKEAAEFALIGETHNSDAISTDSPEEKTETKTNSKEQLAIIPSKDSGPNNACLADTQDCMMSFHEDVTFVAGLGISKIQEACGNDGAEEATSIHDEPKDKSAKPSDDSGGCVNETADCMHSFREDVAYVASLGAKKISPYQGEQLSTSTVEGASGKKSRGAPKDDDSGLFAATADCFVQLKDDIRYGVTQMRDMKLSELEVRGLIVSIAQGLDEPIFLPDADSGSVLTDDFRSSTASVNELDSLDGSQATSHDTSAVSAPSIDAMSADPLPGESVLDSIKKQLELETIRSFGDPVIEEITKTDPPGEEEEEEDYAIAPSKSSNGRADPPACDKPFEDIPSIAPGDAKDGEESTGTSDIEETDELITVEETIEEESVEEEVEEEVIDEENEVMEEVEEENATVETEMETDTDVDQSETSASQENVSKTLEETDDVQFPDLLHDEI